MGSMDKAVTAYKVNTHKVWGYNVGAGYGGVGTGYGDVGAGYGGGGACWELYVPTTVYHLG